jgi:hypothetical protein
MWLSALMTTVQSEHSSLLWALRFLGFVDTLSSGSRKQMQAAQWFSETIQ